MSQVRNKYYQIEWAKQFNTTKAMIDKMQNPRNPKSKNTIAQYCHAVMLFTKYFRKMENPDQALPKTNTKESVDKFVDYLIQKRKLANKSVRGYFYGLKCWLETNNVDTECLAKIELPSGAIVLTEDRIATKEELQKLMNFADIREKTLIEIAISSGLRLNTIVTLKWKNVVWNPYTLLEDQPTQNNNVPAMIKVEPMMGRKTKRKFFTFITPEAKKMLTQYREWRERNGETINPESPLIASMHGIGMSKTLPTKTPFGEQMISGSIFKIWDRLLRKAGLDKKSHKWYELHFHTLRKFFKTKCVNVGIKSNYIDFWMGHRGGYLDDSYFRASLTDHLAEYEKTISQLSLYEAPKSELDRRKEQINDLLKLIPLSPEDKELIQIKIKNASTTQDVDTILDDISEKREPLRNHDCQKIINESELPQWLTKGYRYIATLPSGKIVIDNNNR